MLAGRDSERDALGRLVATTADGHGAAAIVSGGLGLGKSALLDATLEEARAAGVPALVAAAAETEREFAWGVALRLLGGPVRAGSGARRRRLPAGAPTGVRALLGGDPPPPGTDPFPLLNGLWRVIAELASGGPLLVVVDDLHWADGESQQLVAFLASRCDEAPVSLLAAVRPGAAAHGSPASALLADPAATHLELGPLGDGAVRAVVRDRLAAASEGFCAACAQASGGNPFLLAQLVAQAEAEHVPPTGAGAARLPAMTPDAVRRRLDRELARLSPGAVAVARSAAVLGRSPLGRVAALADLFPAAAEAGAAELSACGLLAGGAALELAPPMLATAVLATLGARERAAAAARAAAILHADGEPLDRVAAHLLRADRLGDAQVVAQLRSAAGQALARGSSPAAAAYLGRALDEPPPRAERAGIAFELGSVEADLGMPGAEGHLLEATESDDATLRGQAALRLGQLLVVQGRSPEAERVFGAGAAGLAGGPSKLARELVAAEAMAAAYQPERVGDARRDELERLAPGPPADAERAVLAQRAMHGTFTLTMRRDEALALVDRALAGDALVREESADGLSMRFVTGTLVLAEAFDAELELLDAMLARERERGSLLGIATASYSRSFPLFLTGRVDDAIACVELALDARPHGWTLFVPAASALLGQARMERGDYAAARAALALEHDPQWAGSVLWGMLLGARAELALHEGRPREALALAEELCEQARRVDLRHPAAAHEEAILALAHLHLGDRERARGAAAGELDRARRWGAPGAIGYALRTLATVEGPERGLPLLQEAAAVLDGSPCALERVRVLVALGSVLAARGRRAAAREPFRAALDLAGGLQLPRLAERAHAGLVAAGGRPPEPIGSGLATLTPAERRVAGLAADGMTNRDIAAAQSVTVKAIEKHLHSVFSKLGLSSRRDLPAELRTRS